MTILFLLQEILKSAQQEDRELRYFCVDNVCMKTGNKVYKFPLYRSWKAGERLLSTSIARTCASASLHRWWRWLETVVCLYVGCLQLCSSSPVMKLVRAVTIEPDTKKPARGMCPPLTLRSRPEHVSTPDTKTPARGMCPPLYLTIERKCSPCNLIDWPHYSLTSTLIIQQMDKWKGLVKMYNGL